MESIRPGGARSGFLRSPIEVDPRQVDPEGRAPPRFALDLDSSAVSLDEAIARVTEARAAGANASFVEAPNSLEELADIGRRAPAPIVANMIEKGKTPVLPKERLAELGFHLILYPLAGLFAAAHGLAMIYDKIHRDDTTLGEESNLMAFDEFNHLIGVEAKYKLADRYGVK